jgi:hypothetical protein
LWCAFPALQGGEVEALQRSIAELSGQLEAQAAAVDAAAAERDAYRLSAQEIQERSKVSVRFKAALCGCCMLSLCFSTWLAWCMPGSMVLCVLWCVMLLGFQRQANGTARCCVCRQAVPRWVLELSSFL